MTESKARTCNHIKNNDLTTVYKSSEEIKCTQCNSMLTNKEFRETVEEVARKYNEKLKKKGKKHVQSRR